MGSSHYARLLRSTLQLEQIDGVIVLETIGCFTDEPNSQSLSLLVPDSIYPSTGNFVGFVSNLSSRPLLDRLSTLYALHGHEIVPHHKFIGPGFMPGFNSSDNWSFWQEDIQAIMVTDTGPLRYAHYHKVTDRIEEINFERLALLVEGMVSSLIIMIQAS